VFLRKYSLTLRAVHLHVETAQHLSAGKIITNHKRLQYLQMMKIIPPARISSSQTHLSIPIFGSNRASGHSSIPPFKPFSADMAVRYATVRASFAGKIAGMQAKSMRLLT